MGKYFDTRKGFRKEDESTVKTCFSDAPKACSDPVDWGDQAVLTIEEAAALSFGLSPLKLKNYLSNPGKSNLGDQDIIGDREDLIKRAIAGGKIRTGEPDPTTGEVRVLTKDLVKFFQEDSGKVLQEGQGKLPSIARREIRTGEPDLDSGKIGAPTENIAQCSEANSDKALQKDEAKPPPLLVDASLFDKTYEYYAPELDIAIRAWQAVTSNPNLKQKAVKPQLAKWLKKNHPALSSQAKNRIAIVCNWNKGGGAPRTG